MNVRRNNATLGLHMQKALTLQACSVRTLAAISGLSLKSVRHWLAQMHKSGAVHIENWGEDTRGRLFVPLWRWGKKKDAARPGPQRTSTDRMRDLAARKAAQC